MEHRGTLVGESRRRQGLRPVSDAGITPGQGVLRGYGRRHCQFCGWRRFPIGPAPRHAFGRLGSYSARWPDCRLRMLFRSRPDGEHAPRAAIFFSSLVGALREPPLRNPTTLRQKPSDACALSHGGASAPAGHLWCSCAPETHASFFGDACSVEMYAFPWPSIASSQTSDSTSAPAGCRRGPNLKTKDEIQKENPKTPFCGVFFAFWFSSFGFRPGEFQRSVVLPFPFRLTRSGFIWRATFAPRSFPHLWKNLWKNPEIWRHCRGVCGFSGVSRHRSLEKRLKPRFPPVTIANIV